MSPRVRFEPIGEEIDCAADETVLDAAFRQGYNLVYGCREGQCSACKCFLLEGEVALEHYSGFALSDTERSNGYTLMCRAVPERDLLVELLHYDPDSYRLEHPIRDGLATVQAMTALTDDITGVALRVEEPADFSFLPGQYIDLHVPGGQGTRRSFSIANIPGDRRIELMIKRYPGGRLSGMLGGEIKPGDALAFTGPYGAFHLRSQSERSILMIAGGSGMAPILSVLRQLSAQASERPVRFFYGARTAQDLFYVEEIHALGRRLRDFRFTPVLSDSDKFVHEAVDEYLEAQEMPDPDVYVCGPPPMVQAAEEMLIVKHRIDEQHIYKDKFTASADADGARPGADAGRRSASTKPLGAALAPAGEEPERQFQWFTPSGRRATLYEDVTVDTQPSIHRHLTRGWPVSFEDGRGMWSEASTALRSTDWFAFRDPGEYWERPFYRAETAVEHQIECAVATAIEAGQFEDFASEWVEFLRAHLQIPAYVEHGLWFALATAARDCLSDSVATCVALQAAMKQRSAQAIVLYAMDLEQQFGDFATDTARRAFLTEAPWQPTRCYLERLASRHDWGEVIVAANLCFEPIVATLIRRELGTRAAAANGDTVTPVLARAETQEWEWARAWTAALSRFLLADEVHGSANRRVISGWVQDWLPRALEAGLALAPLLARVPTAIAVEPAIARVRCYAAAMLADAGLPELDVGMPKLDALVEHGLADAGLPELADAGPPELDDAGPPELEDAGPPELGAPAGHEPARRAAAGEATSYDFVGIVMAKSAEGDAVAQILGRRQEIQVLEQPSFWDIRAQDRLTIPYHEVSEQLGYEIDAYSIQHEISAHYGRMVAADDALMLFSDPTEAMEHLMS